MPEQIHFTDNDARQYPFDDHELPPSELPILDRSTLESYGDDDACPFRAVYLETLKGSELPRIVPAGEEGHQAISRTLGEWIDNWADWKLGDVRDTLERHVSDSRPDVQPEAIEGLRRSFWELAKLLYDIRPVNILAYDGGTGSRSGQLALDTGGVRVTSELDLLYAGPGSPGLLYEEDWKTGWKQHTAASVKSAFQFQLHACLVFEKYPDCNSLQVRVWDTRRNSRTAPVLFDREYRDQYIARIGQAVGRRMEWIGGPKAWPSAEKCSGCPAAGSCPEADALTAQATTDPVAMLEQRIATQARLDLLDGHLKAVVKKTGKPVVSGSSAFGPKPPQRKPTVGVYAVEADESEAAE